jgi:3-methyladenine DNA glycosylase AlkD
MFLIMKNKYHLEILAEIKRQAKKKNKALSKWLQGYLGTKKICYFLKSADIKKIAKDFARNHDDFSDKKWMSSLDSLYNGKSTEELSVAARIIGYLPELKNRVCPKALSKWLEKTEGWAEVDILCQSNFSAEETLKNWKEWKEFLTNLSKDKNTHKRRASLVLLVRAVRESSDKRLVKLALQNADRLKKEKEILITKAISWILRDASGNFREEIKSYLDKNENSLPKIAVREARRKLETGTKNGKKLK